MEKSGGDLQCGQVSVCNMLPKCLCVDSPEVLEGRCGISGLPSLGALLPTMLGTERQRNWGLTSVCLLGEVAKREGVHGLEVQ